MIWCVFNTRQRNSTSVTSDDSHDASDDWPLHNIEYELRQIVRARDRSWRVFGIRYNHERLRWEYFLGSMPLGAHRYWTHDDEITTTDQDDHDNQNDHDIINRQIAESWPIHHIRFARGEMVQLKDEPDIQREVMGIRFDDLPDDTEWWYTLRRRLNNRVYDTEYHSRYIQVVPVMLPGVENVEENDMQLTYRLLI